MTLGDQARRQAKAEAQAQIEAASQAFDAGVIDETTWSSRMSAALASAYLRDDDPRWQSGFDGDPELWRQARELILAAVVGDGTMLDIGSATGHLMECLAKWSVERGQHLSIFGLELNPDLAAAGRRRLPAWAERMFEGSALDWQPPMQFSYVRTSLEYVPAGRGPFLIRRLLRDVVAPGGRLIVGPVSDSDIGSVLRAFRHAGHPNPAVHAHPDRNGKMRSVIWVERALDSGSRP